MSRTCRRSTTRCKSARGVTDKPCFIVLRTIIAWPAPNAQNTGKAHGSALGADEVAATKKVLGFDPERDLPGRRALLAHAAQGRRAGQARSGRVGRQPSPPGRAASPERAALLDRLQARRLPDGWASALPVVPADQKGMATRVASGEVLNALAAVLPELWGGSADLAGSNNTTIEGAPSFLPAEHQPKMFKADPLRPGAPLRHPRARHGRDHERHRAPRAHPALRRHVPASSATTCGRRPAGRADGAAGHLRLDPRLDRPRRGRPDPPAGRAPRRAARDPRARRRPPGDANETAAAWRAILEHTDRPAGLVPVPPEPPDP